MKNTFGNSLTVTLFGESHGPAVGAVLDGLAPGIPIDLSLIGALLTKRRPTGNPEKTRSETDHLTILSGVFRGKTTGTPLAFFLPNADARSSDYASLEGVARPSHADYTAHVKYAGYADFRGGGHFSGRVTAPLCVVGGILLPVLSRLGVRVGSHILSCGPVRDDSFSVDPTAEVEALSESPLPFLNEEKGREILSAVRAAAESGDSLGGIIETAVTGLPAGLGEPWFDSVEGLLSHMLYSLGGVKGVSFGDGFALAGMNGSTANDPFRVRNGTVVTLSNHSGGINGGITNGMPLRFETAVRPTPSIAKEQETVDFLKNENTTISVGGRHDPAIVRRIAPVIDSVTAFVLCDLFTQRFGTDVLREGVRP